MKTLFFVLKINDLIIKLFPVLYLVSIYVKYVYICVDMCIINARTWWCICVLMFSLLIGIFLYK